MRKAIYFLLLAAGFVFSQEALAQERIKIGILKSSSAAHYDDGVKGILGNSLVNGYFFNKYYTELAYEKILVVGDSLKDKLERLVNLGIPIGDIAGFDDEIGKILLKDKNLRYITITDTSGKVLYSQGVSKKGEIFNCFIQHNHGSREKVLNACVMDDGKEYYEVNVFVVDSLNKKIGVIIIGIFKEFIVGKLKMLGFNTMLVASMMFIITVLFSAVFYKRLIFNPIKLLINGAREISLGNYKQKININSHDEIGMLAQVFNNMADFLDKTLNELNIAKENLLLEVAAKTKDLNAEKDKLVSVNAEMVRERAAIINMLEDIDTTNKDLSKAQAQIVQTAKMASIGQLAAGLAHEINNPLTGVLNNVQLIKMSAEPGNISMTQAEVNELLDTIEESALRCKNITQSLLDFSHVSKAFIKNLVLNDIILKVSSLVGYELKLQNIQIVLELQPELPLMEGNPQLLQQVFMNLITNARWAIKKKPLDKTGKIFVKTRYNSEKNRIEVEVKDTGIGMSQESLNRIFEPFFTTKDVGEGTGLGLSIIFGIVKEHKGFIEAQSQENVGTAFNLFFPVG